MGETRGGLGGRRGGSRGGGIEGAPPTRRCTTPAAAWSAIDLAGLATWEMDCATGEVFWSPEMFEMFGLEPSPDAPAAGLHAGRRRGGPHQSRGDGCECIATRKPAPPSSARDGPTGRGATLGQMDVATDAAGEVTTLWGNTQDITEREEAARELAASEQHFRVAFDNAPSACR